jgi:hypothetical protein
MADAQAIMAMLGGAVGEGAAGGGGGYGGGGGGSSSGGSGGGNPNALLNIANGGAQAVNGMLDFAQSFYDAFTQPTAQGTLANASKDTSIPYKDYIFSNTWNNAVQDIIAGKDVTLPTGTGVIQVPHNTTTQAPAATQTGSTPYVAPPAGTLPGAGNKSPLDILQNNTTWIPASTPTKKDDKKNKKNGGNGSSVKYTSK